MSGRSLEVTRAYLQRGQAAYRSVWIKVSSRHPLLKAAVVLPLVALVLIMLVFILIVLGLTLLAIALMAAISRGKEKGVFPTHVGVNRGIAQCSNGKCSIPHALKSGDTILIFLTKER